VEPSDGDLGGGFGSGGSTECNNRNSRDACDLIDFSDLWEDERIIDQNLRPCMQPVISDIKNLGQGSVGRIIQRFAGSTPGYNWELTDGRLAGGINAHTSQNYNSSTGTVTTTFDSYKFTNSTDLSVARTILHESIHAYLVAYFRLDPLSASQTFAQLLQDYFQLQDVNAAHHNEMTRNFVNEIAIALQEYGINKGYNLDFEFYQDMAWAGLTTTSAFQALSESVKNRINNTIQVELVGVDTNGNPQAQRGSRIGC
jgi:hypothetical protein